jgi:predicted DNA-binding protein
MSALTLRLPDEKYQRLKDMAHQRGAERKSSVGRSGYSSTGEI